MEAIVYFVMLRRLWLLHYPQVLAAQDELRRAKLIHAEELSKAREVFEERARQIEDKAEKKLQETKVELTVKHRTEIAEVEERKNKQLADLIAHHERAFSDLKNYYNDITLNNLGKYLLSIDFYAVKMALTRLIEDYLL